MANRHELFKTRLQELGMYDEDSDYNGMIPLFHPTLGDTVWVYYKLSNDTD